MLNTSKNANFNFSLTNGADLLQVSRHDPGNFSARDLVMAALQVPANQKRSDSVSLIKKQIL